MQRSLKNQQLAKRKKNTFRKSVHLASNATPAPTNTAAIQRRRSTFSCRKNRAASAFVTNVSEAAAGATSDTSPHDSATSNEKNDTAMHATPSRKHTFDSTTRIAPINPLFARIMSR